MSTIHITSPQGMSLDNFESITIHKNGMVTVKMEGQPSKDYRSAACSSNVILYLLDLK